MYISVRITTTWTFEFTKVNLHAKICLKIVFPNESQHTKNVWIFEFLKMEIHALFFPKNRKFLYVCMFSSTQTSYKFMDLSLNSWGRTSMLTFFYKLYVSVWTWMSEWWWRLFFLKKKRKRKKHVSVLMTLYKFIQNHCNSWNSYIFSRDWLVEIIFNTMSQNLGHSCKYIPYILPHKHKS